MGDMWLFLSLNEVECMLAGCLTRINHPVFVFVGIITVTAAAAATAARIGVGSGET